MIITRDYKANITDTNCIKYKLQYHKNYVNTKKAYNMLTKYVTSMTNDTKPTSIIQVMIGDRVNVDGSIVSEVCITVALELVRCVIHSASDRCHERLTDRLFSSQIGCSRLTTFYSSQAI